MLHDGGLLTSEEKPSTKMATSKLKRTQLPKVIKATKYKEAQWLVFSIALNRTMFQSSWVRICQSFPSTEALNVNDSYRRQRVRYKILCSTPNDVKDTHSKQYTRPRFSHAQAGYFIFHDASQFREKLKKDVGTKPLNVNETGLYHTSAKCSTIKLVYSRCFKSDSKNYE